MTDNSILTEIKKMIGPTESHTAFDTDIIIHINTALSNLLMLGVNPVGDTRLQITGDSENWYDLFGDNEKLNLIQSYIYYSVKLAFDPPTSTSVLEAFKREKDKLEWLINVEAESEENSK